MARSPAETDSFVEQKIVARQILIKSDDSKQGQQTGEHTTVVNNATIRSEAGVIKLTEEDNLIMIVDSPRGD